MRRSVLVGPVGLLLVFLGACSGQKKQEVPHDGAAALDQTQLDFGPVFVGETATRTLRVQNRGRTAGALKVETQAPFAAAVGSATPIAPGDIAEVTVTFSPDGTAPASGQLTATIAGVPGTAELSLAGEGVPRAVDLDRALNFGPVALGQTGEAELSIRNSTALGQVITASISGEDASAFALPSTRLAIPAGQTASLVVQFTPGIATSYSASMKVLACETCDAAIVQLSGTGNAQDLHVSPGSLDFGIVLPGESVTSTVRLFNNDANAVGVSSVRLVAGPGSPFSIEAPELPLALPPGDLAIPITFAPTERVPSSARLRIEAGGLLLEVTISGEGGDAGVQIRPSELAFGTVPTSVQPVIPVSITDVGTGAAHNVTAVRVEGRDASRFLATPSRALPTSARNISLDIPVTFQTGLAGSFEAELVIEIDGTAPRRIPISGTAVSGGYCDLDLEPPDLRFGLQPFDVTAERTLVLRNPASLECTVGPFVLSGSTAFSIPGTDLTQRRLVAARGTLELKVRYTPSRGGGTDRGTIELEQTHPTVKKRTITLEGSGSEPIVELTPNALSFSQGLLGGEQILSVNVHNVASVPLRIASQRLVVTSGTIKLIPAPSLLPVEETVTAHVVITPSDKPTIGNLELDVDGGSAPLVVPITAPRATESCGANCPGPIVACPADVDTWLQRDHALTGAAAGGATACSWMVVSAPNGSTAAPEQKDCSAIFRPDLVGSYQLELTATKAAKTASCRTKLQVKTYPGVWIESRPQIAAEGLDMHLFLPGAGALDDAATWATITDHAFRLRPRPAWGQPGLDDDPIVETGTPAVVRIPAPGAGNTYEVGVHWASPHAAKQLDVDTTVWCGGAVVSSGTTHLGEPYTAAHLGTLRTTAGGGCTFTPSNTSILVSP
jgi:hypothetical protein